MAPTSHPTPSSCTHGQEKKFPSMRSSPQPQEPSRRLASQKSRGVVRWQRNKAYLSHGWTRAASRSRVMPSSRSHSTLYFAGTLALKSATCTCVMCRQVRGKEEMRTHWTRGSRLFGKVDGSRGAGRFRSSSLLYQWNSSPKKAVDLVISSLSSNRSMK